jgi:hypothetical protein
LYFSTTHNSRATDGKYDDNKVITFSVYTQCVRNWHKKLSEAFCTCLQSSGTCLQLLLHAPLSY